MKILALEFSPPQRSVAVVQTLFRKDELHESPSLGSAINSETSNRGARVNRPSEIGANEVIETGPEGIKALDMVAEALRQAGLEREQIECVVVGLGPGSYNGIRAAIALAQGWQLANEVKLLGIGSLEGVAAQAQVDGLSGRVNVIIDAQRNEFYLAVYEITANGRREVEPLRLATLAEVQTRERAGEVLIGPEVTRWFAGGRIVFPRASTLGRLALGRTDFVAAETLEPIYLRETTFVKAPAPRIIS